ncbi:MAG TPA: hypothetical protein VH500_16415 [Nitrososphaeraceae archaeon]
MARFKVRSETSPSMFIMHRNYTRQDRQRKTSERLSAHIKRNHVSIWNWIQRSKPKRIFQSRRRISEFIIDETLIKEAGSECFVDKQLRSLDNV